jgi:hypothetical protein
MSQTMLAQRHRPCGESGYLCAFLNAVERKGFVSGTYAVREEARCLRKNISELGAVKREASRISRIEI